MCVRVFGVTSSVGLTLLWEQHSKYRTECSNQAHSIQCVGLFFSRQQHNTHRTEIVYQNTSSSSDALHSSVTAALFDISRKNTALHARKGTHSGRLIRRTQYSFERSTKRIARIKMMSQQRNTKPSQRADRRDMTAYTFRHMLPVKAHSFRHDCNQIDTTKQSGSDITQI